MTNQKIINGILKIIELYFEETNVEKLQVMSNLLLGLITLSHQERMWSQEKNSESKLHSEKISDMKKDRDKFFQMLTETGALQYLAKKGSEFLKEGNL